MVTSDPFGSSFDSTLTALERKRIEELKADVSNFSPNLDNSAHIASLRSIRAAGRLCPVLGAGISVPIECPIGRT